MNKKIIITAEYTEEQKDMIEIAFEMAKAGVHYLEKHGVKARLKEE